MYGVNPASDDSHRRYVEKLKLNFPLIVDTGGRVARAFRAGWAGITRRTVYVISPDSKVVFAQRGTPPVDAILAAIAQWAGR